MPTPLSHSHVWSLQEYLKAAAVYFEHETTQTGVDGIKAIWVASDDPDVVHEVRFLAPAYFPNVLNEAIVYVSNGVTDGSNTRGVHTATTSQVCYAALRRLSRRPFNTTTAPNMSSRSPTLDAVENTLNRTNMPRVIPLHGT